MIASETASDLQVEVSEHQVTVTRDDRRYRVRGLAKNTSYDQMKINLMVTRDGALHVDTLDLYDARRRITFCKQAADELFVDEATVKLAQLYSLHSLRVFPYFRTFPFLGGFPRPTTQSWLQPLSLYRSKYSKHVRHFR